MKPVYKVATGITVIGIGATILQVAGSEVLKGLEEWVLYWMEYAGFFVIFLGVTLCIFAIIPIPDQVDFERRRAKRGDLKDIHDLCSNAFDGEVSSLNHMKEWFNHNKNIFWVVEKVKRKRSKRTYEIVGYFSIVPLSKAATNLVQNERLKGTDFTSEHITALKEPYHSIYIGGIAASGFRAKGATLTYLKAKVLEVEEAAKELEKVIHFYTRPITSDGVRLMAKNDFHPVYGNVVDPMGRVHVRLNDTD